MASTTEEWEISVSEIQEEIWAEKNSIGGGGGGSCRWSSENESAVYVAVWKESEETLSMDALLWTLNNVVVDVVILVHVFSQTKYIPTPLGKLPINQVNPEQKEKFLAQESGKRRDLLQKFLNACSASRVKVDTVLIESDMAAKAILDLIPILNIRKLVLGATKSTVRRIKAKKGNGTADQIAHNAPQPCEVKIICQGKDVSDMDTPPPSPSPSPSPSPRAAPKPAQIHQQTTADSFACGCFKI